jgi:glyoxylase-like metal-dependent hydrolase (beta-lactamase superfamily II)
MRRLSMILGALIALGLLGVALLVVPALVQVRAVEPPLPEEDALRSLLAIENGPIRLRYVNTSSQQMPGNVLGHTVFLAEWDNGDVFMIDTGMDRAHAVDFGEMLETALGAEKAEPHGSIAELLGADVERVAGVAYTHLHIDHSQGTVPFCEARGSGASVFQTEWQETIHNFNTEEGAAIVADSCLSRGDLQGQTIETTNRFPGLGIVGLGGHTPGSTLFAVPVAGHLWIFSGDITNSKRDLLDDVPKAWIYSNLMVPEHVERNADLRRWLAGLDALPDMTVVVSHDLTDIEASGMMRFGL